jgi:hypothetical protein
MNWGTRQHRLVLGERRTTRPSHPPRLRALADGIQITVDKTAEGLKYRDGMVAPAAAKGTARDVAHACTPVVVFITAFSETHRGGTRSGRAGRRDVSRKALEQVYAAVDIRGAIARQAGDDAASCCSRSTAWGRTRRNPI